VNNYVKVGILWGVSLVVIPNVIVWFNNQSVALEQTPSIPTNYTAKQVDTVKQVEQVYVVEKQEVPVRFTTKPIEPINFTTGVGNGEYYVENPQGRKFQVTNNPDAHNPTWAELCAFLRADLTDRIVYDENSFTCGDFAEKLHNNAEANKIRCAYVVVEFKQKKTGTSNNAMSPTYHSLNAFEVIGRGKVYIDDTSNSKRYYGDKLVVVGEGLPYDCVGLFPNIGQTVDWDVLGVVKEITIEQW